MQEIPATVLSWSKMWKIPFTLLSLFLFFFLSGERKIIVGMFTLSQETTKLKICYQKGPLYLKSESS